MTQTVTLIGQAAHRRTVLRDCTSSGALLAQRRLTQCAAGSHGRGRSRSCHTGRGIPEIVTHGKSAPLVEPAQVRPLREALETLLADPELSVRLAQCGQELIEQRHNPQARFDALSEIYRVLGDSR